MAWYLFVEKSTGDLVSEGSVVPEKLDTNRYDVQDVGDRPDWTIKAWNPSQKALYDRPLPILIDRLDDIQARLLADPDFSAAWNAMNATRRTQLRTGVYRVLASILGPLRFRGENDMAEVG